MLVGNKPNFPAFMNPRIQEEDLGIYQKSPEQSSPKIPSLSRKSMRENDTDKSCKIESFDASNKSAENIEFSHKINSVLSPKKKSLQKLMSNLKTYELMGKHSNFSISKQSPTKRSTPKKNILEIKKKTLFDVFSNFYLTKKFINTLKSITSNRSPKFLSKHHFDIINDLSFFFDIWKKKDQEENFENGFTEKDKRFYKQKTISWEKIQKTTKEFFSKMQVFDSSSSFMIFWNILHLLFILYFFFSIPLEACFEVKLYEEIYGLYYLQYTASFFFLCDILVKCNTAVYLKGKLNKDRKEIVKNYLKTSFLKDTISSLSVFLVLYENIMINLIDNFLLMNFFRILFFLRTRNFSIIFKELEEMFIINQSVHNILSLFKLIFRIILLSHMFACLWFYIGTLNIEHSWITQMEISSEPWWNKYLFSYYFVCITMNTVGYGDVIPQNPTERVFTIVFIYIACGIFAYSINSIGVIVSEIARRENEFQKKLNIINEFMKQKKIYFDLRMRVIKYLEYIWYEEKIEKIEEQSKIIETLSDSLKEELLLEANGAIIRDLKMFTFNFSEELLRNMIPLLKEVRFTPGDLIFMRGNSDNKDLYIIRKGKVEIFLETEKLNTPTILKTIQRGEFFGEISFFSDQERNACARSVDFTTVYMIKKQDFLTLLKKYQKDYQKFCQIRDNINFYEDYKDLYIKCYSCEDKTHLIQDCPNIKYKPIKDVLLHRYFISLDQKRVSYKRKNYHIKALSKISMIENKAFELQAELYPSHESGRTSHNLSQYSENVHSRYSFEDSSIDNKTIKEENEDIEEEKTDKIDKINKAYKKDEIDKISFRINEKVESEDSLLSLSNEESVISSEQMIKIRRKSRKKHILLTNASTESNKDGKKCFNSHTYTALLDNIEGEVYNLIIKESPRSQTSIKSVSIKGKNEEAGLSPTLNFRKTSSLKSKLRSLLTYINELKEGKSETKLPKTDEKYSIESQEVKLLEIDINNRDTANEALKSWDFYFTYNNCEQIIEKFNAYNQKKSHNQKHQSICINNVSPSQLKKNQRSRRQGIVDNKLDSKIKISGNSLMKKNFFQSTNVIENFLNETQFDPKKFKIQYKKMHEQYNFKKIFIDVFKKLFEWVRIFKKAKKSKKIKTAIREKS